MKKSGFIQKYPALVYFSAVFILSWGLILLLAGPGNIPLNAEESEKLLPLFYTMMLVGPGVAGVLITGLVHGKEGFRKLRSRLFKWRVGIGWYAMALFMAPILAVSILFVLARFNPGSGPGTGLSGSSGAVVATGMLTGLMVGLFEEIGWSGFLVPMLRLRQGILDRTESLLLVILSHASLVFTTTVLVPMTLDGEALFTWLILWGTVLWLAVLVISLSNRGRLLQKPKDTI